MIEEIPNYRRLDDTLSCSGMPSRPQLAEIAGESFQVVINLATDRSEGAMADERGIVEGLGLAYFHIPVEWDRPTRENLEEFFRILDEQAGRRIFVHCQANYRATAFIALYRMIRLGWNRDAALEEVRKVWNPSEHPVWDLFLVQNQSWDDPASAQAEQPH